MRSRTGKDLRREGMDLSLITLIDLFAATKQTEGRSSKTVSWYRGMLAPFVEYVSNDDPAKLSNINIDDARDFIASLQNRTTRYENHPLTPTQQGGLSPHTIHGYVRALKAFSSWLADEGYSDEDIFARLKRPKLPRPTINILSDEEINRLISAINPDCPLGARMYVIVLLLLDTGIRASELCTLTLGNTFIDQDYVKVCGKGRKERMVPFGATTKKALIRYITTWRPEPAYDDSDKVALSVYGTPLTYDGLLQAVKRLGRRADVPRVHPHLLRHTFSVRYLMNGGDVMTLRLTLGHTTLDVTQMYMHLAESHVKVQHHRFSPVDRLAIGRKRRRRRP